MTISSTFSFLMQLIENGCDLISADASGRSLLHQLISQQDIEGVQYLVEHGVDINYADKEKDTPLHVTVGMSHVEIATILLEAKADMNAQNNAGKAPLHVVVANKNDVLLNLLLDQPQIKLDPIDKEFFTPLWIALCSHSDEIANRLADKGLIFRTIRIRIIFFWLTLYSPTVKKKKKIGCDLAILDSEGNSFLHRAIDSRDLHTAKWLFSREAQLNHANKKKQTPLHRAALNGLVEMVKLLLQSENVAPNLKDDQGQTAVHLAVRSKNPKILVRLPI